jgi:hypothetical protein
VKHIRGPWEAIPTPETLNGGDYQARIIAKGALSDGNDAIIVGHCNNKNGSGNIHYEPNAKLIAAAPDLLKALQSMTMSMSAHPDCTEGGEFKDMVDIAKAAIKKATE